ncbi:immunoglobulin superfamily containing leucine-rich repeat protein-like [Uloborus diversus]|uniref:immunoglobulin superfamily containing leucine-rich repeat protein-like n=1 Tax=Uloborus diversus TaxID=327109 RepID=UPI002409461C|nr:immunoglobulin superfamily containing leucine-rich repeat protein-like [Uloborus diversus]
MKQYHTLLCVLWSVLALAQGACPAREAISPCGCRGTKNGILLECRGPEETDRIVSVLKNLAGRTGYEVQIESLTTENLPETVQKASAIRLRQCSLGRLIESQSPAWPRLTEVVFESMSIRDNPWSQLKRASSLRYLKVEAFPMPVIGSDFQDVPSSVAYLELKQTDTAVLEPGSMAHLNGLVYLHMVDLPLKKFLRTALPEKMRQLHTFILGNTNIESLEATFFEGMPKLEVLMLNGNKFATMDNRLFTPITHLTHLLIESNPLVCQCALAKWIKNLNLKNSVRILATCYDNITQESKEVINLSENEYCL